MVIFPFILSAGIFLSLTHFESQELAVQPRERILRSRTTYDRHYHHKSHFSTYRGYKYHHTYPKYQYYFYAPYYYYYEMAPGVYYYFRS
ncbi:hypothetical protein PHSC3_001996 [Chlamydiales bacterium STE3]|nr:hypothetical protein PHSC3_001996 [Chlamydiales bacterium STE3]